MGVDKVYLYKGGKAQAVEVKTGLRTESSIQIIEGLNVGDTLITSGTLQLFDESVNLTAGGPGKATMTLTHYIYNISFVETPKFNYAAALSVFILVVVAVLSAIQMKVGDKRD